MASAVYEWQVESPEWLQHCCQKSSGML